MQSRGLFCANQAVNSADMLFHKLASTLNTAMRALYTERKKEWEPRLPQKSVTLRMVVRTSSFSTL